MTKIIFQNMERSDIARTLVQERLEQAKEKFPELARSRITVTLSLHNSALKPGPDLSRVRLHCQGGRYDGLLLQKESFHLYVALAELSDRLLDRLGRFGDRERTRNRKLARQARIDLARSFPGSRLFSA